VTSDFAYLKRFRLRHGLRWPVGRIIGGVPPWHIRHPVKVILVRGTTSALVATCVLVALAGCGTPAARGPSSGLNLHDPRAVARAYAVAEFRCDEDGAGRRYDLSTTTSPAGRWPRDAYLREEQRRGCHPRPLPPLRVALRGPVAGDYATVDVYAGQASGVLLLVRVQGAWRVDTYLSDTTQVSA
jgi:hypothetical protein